MDNEGTTLEKVKGRNREEKFNALDDEKRERILNAARKEFAAKGYNNASTNEIVKEAGISKGALFHYFGSKQDLYKYLFENTAEILKKEFFAKIDLSKADIFQRLRQVLRIKLEMLLRHPASIDFMTKTFYENSEVSSYLEEKTKELTELSYGTIFKNIDTSKFREDVDIKKAMDVILWTSQSYSMAQKEKLNKFPEDKPDYQAMFDEMEEYFSLLQKTFYK